MIKPSLALIAGMLSASAVAQPAPPHQLSRSVPLGAPDRWDYVTFDPGTHRVFVAHGDRLAVVDGRNGAVLGEVGGMPGGTHGIAIARATGKAYTDNGKAGVAVAFDIATLKTGARIPAASDADAVVFDKASSLLSTYRVGQIKDARRRVP